MEFIHAESTLTPRGSGGKTGTSKERPIREPWSEAEEVTRKAPGAIPGEASLYYAWFGRFCPFVFSMLNLISRTRVWRTPAESGNNDAYWRYNSERATSRGLNTGHYAGPHHPAVCVVSHARVKEHLQSFAAGEQRGVVIREPGFLGYTEYGLMWPEMPWKTIELGTPVEPHELLRPLLVQLMGSPAAAGWSAEGIATAADDFFRGRASFDTNVDVQVWVQQQLHRVCLGLEITSDEAKAVFGIFDPMVFNAFMAPFPRCVQACFQAIPQVRYRGTLAQKEALIQKYKRALLQRLPDASALSDVQLTWLASGVLDVFLFAGGKSVVTLIPMLLQVPLSAWGKKNLPLSQLGGDQLPKLVDERTVRLQYVWEMARRFAPVSGFVYYNSEMGKRIFLDLSTAQLDPAAWGADSLEFKLRPLKEYADKNIGFADFASRPEVEAWPRARSCPGKDFALVLCDAFVAAYARAARAASHKAARNTGWKPFDRKTGAPLAPEEMKLTAYGITTCVLKLG